VLLADLHRLLAGLRADPDHLDDPDHPQTDGLADVLTSLVTHLRGTAPSYAGLRLTLTTPVLPVSLTDVDQAADLRTTLRIPLRLLLPTLDPGSRVVFYATRPGAFLDLAADLEYALDGAPGASRSPPPSGAPGPVGEEGSDRHRPTLELDADLPTVPLRPGLTGVEENWAVNRAVGYLIADGQQPEHAIDMLRRGAAAEGVALHVYAARIVSR
jgi:hypothetical protein